MAEIINITDISAPELKIYSGLKDAGLRTHGEENGLFIAETLKVINYALDAGYRPESMLTENRCIDRQAAETIARCGDIPVYTAERELLASLTGYRLTRGVLCAMRRKPMPDIYEVCSGAKRIAVLENIADPSNVGALFRSAAALGMDGLLLTANCCDALYRRAVRVSMGAVFQVPWTRVGGDWIERLTELGFETAAMALHEGAVNIEYAGLEKTEKLAVVLGSEGDGLSKETIEKCGHTLIIPMARGINSLNVAAAGAIAFWELRNRDYKQN